MNPNLYQVTVNGIPLDSGYTRLDLARAQFVSIYRAMWLARNKGEEIEEIAGHYVIRLPNECEITIRKHLSTVPIRPDDVWQWEDALSDLKAWMNKHRVSDTLYVVDNTDALSARKESEG